jgi:WD40 repeat protein
VGVEIQDVKWSHGQFSTHIATAAANGKVILYDLNRAGVELARLHEHARQVHKIAFNPHQGHLLLSASHDMSVRLWDLREMRKDIMTCPSREQFSGMNGGIRDVQWSPTDAVEFAFGTDNGTIQRWDFRQPKGPKQKITAHDQRTCTSIDWHPDGKHMLSASVDKSVKVWDLSIDGRRQKPTIVLTTPYPVYRARWRPPYWSDEYHEKGAYQCTQLATSYDEKHSPIHVWDLRRPYLPFREINKFATAPTDMIWHSRDTLWTVGKEGIFQQNDAHLAPKVVDRRNLQALAVSPSGELSAFVQKRLGHRHSTVDYSETYNPRDKRSSPEKGSLRSSADDSLDDSFLSSSSIKRHHGRTTSSRSAKSFGSTPPSEAAPKVIFLTDSMVIHSHSFKPNQVAIRGTLPGAINVQLFAYLAQKYKVLPFADLPTMQSFLYTERVFEHNAQMAQRAAFYRISETWRIIGQSITVAIRHRAELHRNHRQIAHMASASASSHHQPQPAPIKSKAHEGHSPLPNPALRAILDRTQPPQGSSQHLTATESTSNVATPLARPLTTSVLQALQTLPDPDHAEELSLPPAVAGPHSSESSALPGPKGVNQSLAQFSSPNWYESSDDLDERRALIGSWRAPPRAPLNLEPTNAQGINIRIPPRLNRHDSDESFAMFSASTDSQRGTSIPSSFASGKSQSHSQGMESIPENWQQHGPSGSSFGKPKVSPSNENVAQLVVTDDNLGKSLQISPTTIPIDELQTRATVPMQRVSQQGPVPDASDESAAYSKEKAVHDIEILRRNNQLLRHDSSESEAYTSSGGRLSAMSIYSSFDMEASGTIVPDIYEGVLSPQVSKPHGTTLNDASDSAPPVIEPAAEDPLNLSDFQAMHVEAEEGLAFAVIGLLNNSLDFLTTTGSDAQTSSTLLLLLAPLLPRTQNVTDTYGISTAEVLPAFGDAFATLGFSPAQIETVASTHLTPLLATGINPYQAEAILHTYHAQLHSLSLFNSTASLRRLAYPMYPAVYEQGLKDTQLGLLCLSCKSPINNPKDKMRCETCKRAQAPCPICWGRYPAFESIAARKKGRSKHRSSVKDREHKRKRSSLMSTPLEIRNEVDIMSPSVPEKLVSPQPTLWTWCPLCGHGGHTNCLSTWFMDPILSEGACATEGCLCDCVAGSRREEKIRELLAKKAEKEKSKVVRKGDDWKIQESKAVSAVRGAFGDAAVSVRDPNQPARATATPGLPPSKKDDSRRVRVVDPQDNLAPQHPPPQNSLMGKTFKY